MIKDHYDVIRENKIAFWWFLGRRDFFQKILKKEFRTKLDLGVDIGCGPGTNESLYSDFAEIWISLDYSKESFKKWERNNPAFPVLADICSIPLKQQSSDVCFLLDVLEHLPEEKKSLKEINRIMKKDSALLLSVPAFNNLWSYHDEQAGHKRRYRKRDIQNLAGETGFKIIKCYYFNAFLFLPILIVRKIMKLSSRGKNTLEINLSPRWLDKYFYLILKIENLINLNIFKIPFGTSIVAILRKK
ncbi:MAG: class I SAM-dependent methyltransferase [Acidobacteria bacterium]|nr:class I SAM-dependent methyltransferase [Acidobacteriota bacterium]